MKSPTSKINRRITKLLRSFADNKQLTIEQNKHIKVSGVYGGSRKTLRLSSSPNSNYQSYIRSNVKRFLDEIGVDYHYSQLIF